MRAYVARIGAGTGVDAPAVDFEHLAVSDRFGEHGVTDDPDAADVILFTQCHVVDWRLRAIREHSLVKKYREKVMVYDTRDRPWRSFPGVYVSFPARGFDGESQRAWGYPSFSDPAVRGTSVDPDLLFSFRGSATAACRKPLFELRHGDAIVEEARNFNFWEPSADGHERQRARYDEVLTRSRFVLCPRGRGTSTFRLYEALAAGRVPVIISDDWVAPAGADWEACSLRWPEGRTRGLVQLLQERDREWPLMSSAAASTYGEYFATEVCFHRVVDLCSDLHAAGGKPSPPWQVHSRSLAAALRERWRRTA
jgi:hypothetical protein